MNVRMGSLWLRKLDCEVGWVVFSILEYVCIYAYVWRASLLCVYRIFYTAASVSIGLDSFNNNKSWVRKSRCASGKRGNEDDGEIDS